MRAGFVSAIVLLSLAFGVQPASAVELPVAGPFTGTAPFEVGAGCGPIRQSMVGTADLATLGESAVDLSFCVVFSNPPGAEAGSFTITGSEGTIVGDIPTGTFEPGVPGGVHLDLIVTGGTGAFDGATGALSVDGTLQVNGPATAQIAGTIDVPTPTPQSKADCMKGGWRNFSDESGTPFRNQGQCIRYVVHHS